jgi:DNA end-binding protein Ku
MHSIWNGHVTFGLISIPVSLHSAVESSERVAFRLLHRKDHAPIIYKKFCSKEDVEVPADEVVRGFEVEDDEFAVVEKEEIEKAGREAGAAADEIEVLQFVELGALNPLSFDHPYYMAPRKGGEKATACCARRSSKRGESASSASACAGSPRSRRCSRGRA